MIEAAHVLGAALAGACRRVSPAWTAWLLAQDAGNLRAVATRALCAELSLPDALTAALVARAASPAVVATAARRFPGELLDRLQDDERDVAADLVARLLDAERAGGLP